MLSPIQNARDDSIVEYEADGPFLFFYNAEENTKREEKKPRRGQTQQQLRPFPSSPLLETFTNLKDDGRICID